MPSETSPTPSRSSPTPSTPSRSSPSPSTLSRSSRTPSTPRSSRTPSTLSGWSGRGLIPLPASSDSRRDTYRLRTTPYTLRFGLGRFMYHEEGTAITIRHPVLTTTNDRWQEFDTALYKRNAIVLGLTICALLSAKPSDLPSLSVAATRALGTFCYAGTACALELSARYTMDEERTWRRRDTSRGSTFVARTRLGVGLLPAAATATGSDYMSMTQLNITAVTVAVLLSFYLRRTRAQQSELVDGTLRHMGSEEGTTEANRAVERTFSTSVSVANTTGKSIRRRRRQLLSENMP